MNTTLVGNTAEFCWSQVHSLIVMLNLSNTVVYSQGDLKEHKHVAKTFVNLNLPILKKRICPLKTTCGLHSC